MTPFSKIFHLEAIAQEIIDKQLCMLVSFDEKFKTTCGQNDMALFWGIMKMIIGINLNRLCKSLKSRCISRMLPADMEMCDKIQII